MILRTNWQQALDREFDKLYFKRLVRWLRKEREAGKEILPADEDVLEGLNHCPPAKVKVVIIGDEPYSIPGFSDGLAFSVQLDKGISPALNNIFKELKTDLDLDPPNHGCLLKWTRSGVLLLNTVLTVEANKPGSHKGKGWEQFTDAVITFLNRNRNPIVFMLWGKEACAKSALIKDSKHLVIKSTHPSPFSAAVSTNTVNPFLGSRPFSIANKHLSRFDIRPVDWPLVDRL